MNETSPSAVRLAELDRINAQNIHSNLHHHHHTKILSVLRSSSNTTAIDYHDQDNNKHHMGLDTLNDCMRSGSGSSSGGLQDDSDMMMMLMTQTSQSTDLLSLDVMSQHQPVMSGSGEDNEQIFLPDSILSATAADLSSSLSPSSSFSPPLPPAPLYRANNNNNTTTSSSNTLNTSPTTNKLNELKIECNSSNSSSSSGSMAAVALTATKRKYPADDYVLMDDDDLMSTSDGASIVNKQAKPNISCSTRLDSDYDDGYFTLTLRASASQLSTVDDLHVKVDSVSQNVQSFLGFTQDEMIDSSLASYLHHDYHVKFVNLFKSSSFKSSSTPGSKISFKPFQCQMLRKSATCSSDMTTVGEASSYESMLVVQSTSQGLLGMVNEMEKTIDDDPSTTSYLTVQIRPFESLPSSSSMFTTDTGCGSHNSSGLLLPPPPIPPLHTTSSTPLSTLMQQLTTNTAANNIISPSSSSTSLSASPMFNANGSATSSHNNNSLGAAMDCNMDQITTRMTTRGTVLSVDTSHFKSANSSTASSSAVINSETGEESHPFYSGAKAGLLYDLRQIRNVKLIDYVHTNDLSHLNKHISDVIAKGENTSAIYRLKVTEKYAFIQTHSRLVKYVKDEENQFQLSDLTDADTDIIHSCHSVIKEIDTEVEMKGSASTSLMKTLISKRPLSSPQSATSRSVANPTSPVSGDTSVQSATLVLASPPVLKSNSVTSTTTANTTSSGGIKPPHKRKSSNASTTSVSSVSSTSRVKTAKSKSSDQQLMSPTDQTETSQAGGVLIKTQPKTPSTPNSCTTKFALSMLGLNKSEQHQQQATVSTSSDALLKRLLTVDDDTFQTDENEDEGDEDNGEEDDDDNELNKTPTTPLTGDSENERRQKEDELKKMLHATLPGSSSTTTSVKEKSKSSVGKQRLGDLVKSSSNSPVGGVSQKDDIILRALLNTSDLEPQVIQIESVFELGNKNGGSQQNLLDASRGKTDHPQLNRAKSVTGESKSKSRKANTNEGAEPKPVRKYRKKNALNSASAQLMEMFNAAGLKALTQAVSRNKSILPQQQQQQQQQISSNRPNHLMSSTSNYFNTSGDISNDANLLNTDDIEKLESLITNENHTTGPAQMQHNNHHMIGTQHNSHHHNDLIMMSGQQSMDQQFREPQQMSFHQSPMLIRTGSISSMNGPSNIGPTGNNNKPPPLQIKNNNNIQPPLPSPLSTLSPMLKSSSLSIGASSGKDDDINKQRRIEAITQHLKTDLIDTFKTSLISTTTSTKTMADSTSASMSQSANMTGVNQTGNAFFPPAPPASMPVDASHMIDGNEDNVPNLTINPGLSSPMVNNFSPYQRYPSTSNTPGMIPPNRQIPMAQTPNNNIQRYNENNMMIMSDDNQTTVIGDQYFYQNGGYDLANSSNNSNSTLLMPGNLVNSTLPSNQQQQQTQVNGQQQYIGYQAAFQQRTTTTTTTTTTTSQQQVVGDMSSSYDISQMNKSTNGNDQTTSLTRKKLQESLKRKASIVAANSPAVVLMSQQQQQQTGAMNNNSMMLNTAPPQPMISMPSTTPNSLPMSPQTQVIGSSPQQQNQPASQLPVRNRSSSNLMTPGSQDGMMFYQQQSPSNLLPTASPQSYSNMNASPQKANVQSTPVGQQPPPPMYPNNNNYLQPVNMTPSGHQQHNYPISNGHPGVVMNKMQSMQPPPAPMIGYQKMMGQPQPGMMAPVGNMKQPVPQQFGNQPLQQAQPSMMQFNSNGMMYDGVNTNGGPPYYGGNHMQVNNNNMLMDPMVNMNTNQMGSMDSVMIENDQFQMIPPMMKLNEDPSSSHVNTGSKKQSKRMQKQQQQQQQQEFYKNEQLMYQPNTGATTTTANLQGATNSQFVPQQQIYYSSPSNNPANRIQPSPSGIPSQPQQQQQTTANYLINDTSVNFNLTDDDFDVSFLSADVLPGPSELTAGSSTTNIFSDNNNNNIMYSNNNPYSMMSNSSSPYRPGPSKSQTSNNNFYDPTNSSQQQQNSYYPNMSGVSNTTNGYDFMSGGFNPMGSNSGNTGLLQQLELD